SHNPGKFQGDSDRVAGSYRSKMATLPGREHNPEPEIEAAQGAGFHPFTGESSVVWIDVGSSHDYPKRAAEGVGGFRTTGFGPLGDEAGHSEHAGRSFIRCRSGDWQPLGRAEPGGVGH